MLSRLVFLSLADNRIHTIRGLANCKLLTVIDLGGNLLTEISQNDFPRALEYLVLSGNPCEMKPTFRIDMVQMFPNLVELDEILITSKEKYYANLGNLMENDRAENEDTDNDVDQRDEAFASSSTMLCTTSDAVKAAIERSRARQARPGAECSTSAAVQQALNESLQRRRNFLLDFKARRQSTS
jgi:hypothetical protein